MDLNFSIATDVDRANVILKYGYPFRKHSIYVAKNGEKVVGFAAFEKGYFAKIKIDKRFRSNNNARKFFEFALRTHFENNPKLKMVDLRAAAEVTKKQETLEKWYERIGGIREIRNSDIFYFVRPQKGESFIDSRKRFRETRSRILKKLIPKLKPKSIVKSKPKVK